MEVCENCLGINIVYIGNEHDKYYCKDCGFESEEHLKSVERNLSDSQISLILYMIGFVQYDKEQFQFYMEKMFGKEYSEKEIKNMMDELRTDINILRFK